MTSVQVAQSAPVSFAHGGPAARAGDQCMVDAIRAYTAAGTLAFHVPGHKLGHGPSTGLRDLVGAQTLANDVSCAVGKICAELVVPYPPGIPVLAPGELVTDGKVAYLADAVAAGCTCTAPPTSA